MPPLHYRAAVAHDAAHCVALRGRTRENAISAKRLAAMGITSTSWGDDIETGKLPGHVCVVDGSVVGYCFGDRDTGEVVVLALLPEFEGRGIGRELLSRVVRDLRSLGHRRLFLGSARDPSTRSYGFYRHLGWRSTGQLDANNDEVLELVLSEGADRTLPIRAERADDLPAVHALNAAAFASPAEANLVDRLRREAEPCVSLVAEAGDGVAGHIMFTPVVLSNHPHLRIMGLAPVAVASAHRRRGVGAALVASGLERCARLGYGAVVVVGDPNYYRRFGFESGAGHGLTCEYDVPVEAFMVRELQPDYLAGASGTVSYHAAFADA